MGLPITGRTCCTGAGASAASTRPACVRRNDFRAFSLCYQSVHQRTDAMHHFGRAYEARRLFA